MALQTLTSTVTAAPSSTASTAATDDPPDNLNSRNSVPFSFLVAFLALFVAFMGLGLWARRIVFFVRRRLGLPVPEPPQRRHHARPKKPVLWDVCPDGRVQPDTWEGMEPLSSWYCRDVPVVETRQEDPEYVPAWPPVPPIMQQRMPRRGGVPILNMPPPPSPSQSPPRPWRDRIHPVTSLRNWWLDLLDPMRHVPQKNGTIGKGAVDQLQVAVFISMPSPVRGKRVSTYGGLEALGEIAIGIAGTPWDYDESVLNKPETRT